MSKRSYRTNQREVEILKSSEISNNFVWNQMLNEWMRQDGSLNWILDKHEGVGGNKIVCTIAGKATIIKVTH